MPSDLLTRRAARLPVDGARARLVQEQSDALVVLLGGDQPADPVLWPVVGDGMQR